MDSSGRPNIATFDTGNLPSAELDISLARPYNKELIRVSAKVDSGAALVWKKEKKEILLVFATRRYQLIGNPLSDVTIGRWGTDAIDFSLRALAFALLINMIAATKETLHDSVETMPW